MSGAISPLNQVPLWRAQGLIYIYLFELSITKLLILGLLFACGLPYLAVLYNFHLMEEMWLLLTG